MSVPKHVGGTREGKFSNRTSGRDRDGHCTACDKLLTAAAANTSNYGRHYGSVEKEHKSLNTGGGNKTLDTPDNDTRVTFTQRTAALSSAL